VIPALIMAVLAAVTPPGSGYDGGGGRDEPKARLTLAYTAEAGYAAAVKLDCYPPGGGHPQPGPACATLARAGGDPERIPHTRIYCLTVYAPITAEVSGVWRGRTIAWRHTFGNRCEMRRATGVLLAF
jgi:subtilisin inhibitor-like